MAGRHALDVEIGVRIPVSEPFDAVAKGDLTQGKPHVIGGL